MADLDKTLNFNADLRYYETVASDGDYTMIIGAMGEGDHPHYLIVNHKYGVVEAGSGALSEAHKLWEFCLGRKATLAVRDKSPDLFN